MLLNEQRRDLFTVPDDWHLAHCIAEDLGMGKGIALPMRKKFKLRGKIEASGESIKHPTCILTGRVFNLITKRRSGGKPSYDTLRGALEKMRDIALEKGVRQIAMPKIGCGLDRLQWGRVREMLLDVFADTDVEILVCIWR